MFETLEPLPTDALLGLLRLHAADPRAGKIDLGVGVFRDEAGRTPVMRAVKEAESRVWEAQETKSYQGMEGDRDFLTRLQAQIFGEGEPMAGVQTIGGSGALRLAADLLHRAGTRRIWMGEPTWPNHRAILEAGGLQVLTFRHILPDEGVVDMGSLREALSRAEAGDAVLLHGCCHNPTGAGYSPTQWQEVAELLRARKAVPLVDLAYAGLGRGLAEDVAASVMLRDTLPEAMFALSCSKNFALYRDRVGALFVKAQAPVLPALQSQMEALGRITYSMPAAHGAAIVGTILADPALREEWLAELDSMRRRIAGLRTALARELGRFWNGAGRITEQEGMFSMLPLMPAQVEALRTEHGIYMAGSGRINVAGLRSEDVPRFSKAVGATLREGTR
jgi:aromatic-amino-acid transaminase